MTAGISTVGRAAKGFTYLGVLVLLSVMAVLGQVAVERMSHVLTVEREAELLFRGMAYRKAIASYFGLGRTYPRRLEDLVMDPRHLFRRHLRRLYADPFGGEWRLIYDTHGGIIGVASRSRGKPVKRDGFVADLDFFSEAETYRDWRFVYVPKEKVPK